MRRASCAAKPPHASWCPMWAPAWDRPGPPVAAARSSFPSLRRRAAVAAVVMLCAPGLLIGCAGAQLGGREPVPGGGPGGKPMRTATETAGGLPPGAPAIVDPVSPRVHVSDSYLGTPVQGPYRWRDDRVPPQLARC